MQEPRNGKAQGGEEKEVIDKGGWSRTAPSPPHDHTS
jgi:hypothetical protein